MTLRNRKTGQTFDESGKPLKTKRSVQSNVSAPTSSFFKPSSPAIFYATGQDPHSLIRMSFDFYQSVTGIFKQPGEDQSKIAGMASSAVALAQQAPDILKRIYSRFSPEEKEAVSGVASEMSKYHLTNLASSMLSMNPLYFSVAVLLIQMGPAAAEKLGFTFHTTDDVTLCDNMACNPFYVTDASNNIVLKGAQGQVETYQRYGNSGDYIYRIAGDDQCVTLNEAETMLGTILDAGPSNRSELTLSSVVNTCRVDKDESFNHGWGARWHAYERVIVQGLSDDECNTLKSNFTNQYADCEAIASTALQYRVREGNLALACIGGVVGLGILACVLYCCRKNANQNDLEMNNNPDIEARRISP